MENSGVVGSDQRTEDPVPNPFRFDSIPSFFLALLSVRSVMSSSTASASTSELGRGASARISRRKSVAASKREDSGRPARTFAAVAVGSSPCHAIPDVWHAWPARSSRANLSRPVGLAASRAARRTP